MNQEMKQRYDRGRRLVKEFECVLDNYQKLTFFLNTDDNEERDFADLKAQALIMEDYMNILRDRIKFANY